MTRNDMNKAVERYLNRARNNHVQSGRLWLSKYTLSDFLQELDQDLETFPGLFEDPYWSPARDPAPTPDPDADNFSPSTPKLSPPVPMIRVEFHGGVTPQEAATAMCRLSKWTNCWVVTNFNGTDMDAWHAIPVECIVENWERHFKEQREARENYEAPPTPLPWDRHIHCTCTPDQRDWNLVLEITVPVPLPGSDYSCYLQAARSMLGDVLCHTCGRLAFLGAFKPGAAVPSGSCYLDRAVGILQRFYTPDGRRRLIPGSKREE